MEITDFVSLISNVGFPIAVCIALGIFIFYQNKQLQTERKEQQDLLLQVTKSVDNNTATLQRLLDKME